MEQIQYREAKDAFAEDDKFIAYANAAAVEFSTHTLKSLLLLNGGATVAMLGFVATISGGKNSSSIDISEAVASLQIFCSGAGLAVLAIGLAYLVMYFQGAQVQAHSRSWDHPHIGDTEQSLKYGKIHRLFHILAVIAAIGSLVLFSVATYQTGSIVAGTSDQSPHASEAVSK